MEVTLLLGKGKPSFSQVTSGMEAAWDAEEGEVRGEFRGSDGFELG